MKTLEEYESLYSKEYFLKKRLFNEFNKIQKDKISRKKLTNFSKLLRSHVKLDDFFKIIHRTNQIRVFELYDKFFYNTLIDTELCWEYFKNFS